MAKLIRRRTDFQYFQNVSVGLSITEVIDFTDADAQNRTADLLITNHLKSKSNPFLLPVNRAPAVLPVVSWESAEYCQPMLNKDHVLGSID